jgi:hypothetical protein
MTVAMTGKYAYLVFRIMTIGDTGSSSLREAVLIITIYPPQYRSEHYTSISLVKNLILTGFVRNNG